MYIHVFSFVLPFGADILNSTELLYNVWTEPVSNLAEATINKLFARFQEVH